MPARLRLLGAKRRPEAVHFAEAHHARFDVELSRLRQIGRTQVEVLRRKEVRRALGGHRRQDRRIEAHKAFAVQVFLRRGDHLGPDTQQRVLLGRAHVQMAVRHQELGAVLLGRDRVVVGDMHRLDVNHIELETARRTLVRARRTGDPHRRLLREVLRRREDIIRDVPLKDHALDHTRSIAQHHEDELALFGLVVYPAGQCHLLAHMLGDLVDIGRR